MDLIAMESLAMDLNNRDDKKIKNRYGAVGHGFDRRLPLHRGQPLLPGFHPLPGPTTLLLDLLSWDPPLFLDRYGSHLTPPELRPFETLALRTYELDVHLSRLKTSRAPVATTTVKNRRRAYLDRLVGAGDYFSEEAMREREPWLHYDLVGRFQDPAGRGMAQPGERWSETLMQRWEEAEMVEKIRKEQQRLGVEKKDWIGGEVEVVEEEEEEQMEGLGLGLGLV